MKPLREGSSKRCHQFGDENVMERKRSKVVGGRMKVLSTQSTLADAKICGAPQTPSTRHTAAVHHASSPECKTNYYWIAHSGARPLVLSMVIGKEQIASRRISPEADPSKEHTIPERSFPRTECS